MNLSSHRKIFKLSLTLIGVIIVIVELLQTICCDPFPLNNFNGDDSNNGESGSFDSIMLPKRFMSPTSKIDLHLSENDIEQAFSMGKDMVYRNWRLEDELVRDGIFTNMSHVSAVSRHQAVTTTLPLGNILDHNQEVFEETSKILLRK
ncbi:hypothetical protein BLA29_009551 [Euroglyphus maynei]|uniref:Uncharacterized protein n=1 Tax=Euroglyphus maynei TaxID=6958 RepID=A0A1Y3BHA3_EURMA|nr:hypothetical protein BLA29_009551 [Euroglyphus maynei]